MPIIPAPPRSDQGELMDLPQEPRVMEACLRDLARLNTILGVGRIVLGYLRRFARAGPPRLQVADVATGAADLPRAAVRWGRSRGVAVTVVAIDNHPMTAALARRWSQGYPEISVLRGDARALPLADHGVDVAVLTSALHHLPAEEAVRALRELDRVSLRGFVVTDLIRSSAAYVGARLLALTVMRSPLTRVDGPRSVLRAFTETEAHALIEAAGIDGARIAVHPFFRLAIVKGV